MTYNVIGHWNSVGIDSATWLIAWRQQTITWTSADL